MANLHKIGRVFSGNAFVCSRNAFHTLDVTQKQIDLFWMIFEVQTFEDVVNLVQAQGYFLKGLNSCVLDEELHEYRVECSVLINLVDLRPLQVFVDTPLSHERLQFLDPFAWQAPD